MPAPTQTIHLRSIQPGQVLVRIPSKRFKGPRGGRYVFAGVAPRKPAVFERHALSRDGRTRTFYFANHAPLAVADDLCLKLQAEVQS